MTTSAESNAAQRRYPLRMPRDWVAPVPAWKSTFAESVDSVSMCVIGFQHPPEMQFIAPLQVLSAALPRAQVCDFASSDAGQGLQETVCIVYWLDADSAAADLASPAFMAVWQSHQLPGLGYGVFREMSNLPFARSETLFSGPEHQHGMSQMRTGKEGPIPHHQYWGGMRDRIPLSANDPLAQSGTLHVVEQSESAIVVEAHENLCLIRSGQDWSACDAQQLAEYRDTIEPALEAGMAFLRDRGHEVGCYSCRFMNDRQADGTLAPRSSGLAYFRTMEDLENWSEHHPTHLQIFNAFLGMAPKYGPDLQLKLWHEVSVLPAGGQRAEYVNCRQGSGLTGGLDAVRV